MLFRKVACILLVMVALVFTTYFIDSYRLLTKNKNPKMIEKATLEGKIKTATWKRLTNGPIS